jgi:hypothetical protein
MKKYLALAAAAAALATAVAPAVAQPSIGVSIGIHQPGVYGRINIGELPPPALVLAQPVLIAPPRMAVERRPIYLYVPPEHQQNWRRYCGRYNACGQPVYFVQDRWVRERYAEQHPGWDRGHRGGPDWHDDRRDHGDRDDHREHREHRDDHRGPDRRD